MRAVPSMISTGGSHGAARVERVILFVGFCVGFVCCWGWLLVQLVWMVLDVLVGLFLFWFDLITRKLTMEAIKAIWSLSSLVSVSCFFNRALYNCWLEWLMSQEM